MAALKEPRDVAKPIQEKLVRDKEILKVKHEKINDLLNEISTVIHNDTIKPKFKVQRKVLIHETTLIGKTVFTECIADENDAITKQRFYGDEFHGLTGIELLFESGKTFMCGNKNEQFFSEIS